MPEVVDRLVIDVSSSLTALHLVIHGHYQVLDPVLKHFIIVSLGFWFIIGAPVVDFRGKPFFFRAVLASFVHVFMECCIAHISGPAILFSGGSRGGAGGTSVPPYFQTKLRPEGPKKHFWRPGPPLSQSLSGTASFPAQRQETVTTITITISKILWGCEGGN